MRLKMATVPVNSELTAKQASPYLQTRERERLSAAAAADLETAQDSPITVFFFHLLPPHRWKSPPLTPPPPPPPTQRGQSYTYALSFHPDFCSCHRHHLNPCFPDSPGDTLSPLVSGNSGEEGCRVGRWWWRGGRGVGGCSCGSAICAYMSVEPGIDASRFNRRAGVISQRITVGVTKELSTTGCTHPIPTHPLPPSSSW